MVAADFIFILIIAIVLSSVLIWAFRWRHPAQRDAVGASILFLFLILMFTMWAGSAWIPPWGPVLYGSYWFSLLVIGIVITLLILAISAPPRRTSTLEVVDEESRNEPTSEQPVAIFGIFFWALLAILLLAAVMHDLF